MAQPKQPIIIHITNERGGDETLMAPDGLTLKQAMEQIRFMHSFAKSSSASTLAADLVKTYHWTDIGASEVEYQMDEEKESGRVK